MKKFLTPTCSQRRKISAFLCLGALLVLNLNSFGHTFSFSTSGGDYKTAVGWQGGATNITALFGSGVPDGTQVYTWTVASQSWSVNTYDAVFYDGWDNPNEIIGPAQGFLVRTPENHYFTLTGPDMPGTNYTYNLASNKWHLLTFAYPRAGYLEKNPSPDWPEPNLNFPGRHIIPSVGDRYSRWDSNYQDWAWTQRTNDVDNPTGGYNSTNTYGARWFIPGSTNVFQINGVSNNWINVGEPIFVNLTLDRAWHMYKSNDWYVLNP